MGERFLQPSARHRQCGSFNQQMDFLSSEENEIPGHSRDCSLRTISPLLETDLVNRRPLTTDSADTLVAVQFAKRYEFLRKENESLRQTVIKQEQQIEKLKNIIKNIQSDGYSSDSRHEKSSSTQSSLPVVRVTPQKRDVSSSSTQTPRSSRRSPRFRLELGNSSESESTPTPQPRQSVVHYQRNVDENVVQRPASAGTITPVRTPARRRLTAPTRSLSTSAVSSAGTTSASNNPSHIQTSGNFLLMGTDSTTEDHRLANATDSPGYYLRLRRPDFIEGLEERQNIIRWASQKRSEIEAVKKTVVRAVAEGKVEIEDVEDILLVDPTQIKAFPQREMKDLTRRNLAKTREVQKGVKLKEKKISDAANRILAGCYNLRTRNKFHGSPLNISAVRL